MWTTYLNDLRLNLDYCWLRGIRLNLHSDHLHLLGGELKLKRIKKKYFIFAQTKTERLSHLE